MRNPILLTSAKALRKRQTKAEGLLWKHLKARQLNGVKFRRQQPVGSYIVDFVSFEQKIVIEIDGGQHIKRKDYDVKRDAWFQKKGFRVLRFWNSELFQDTEGVLEVIRRNTLPGPSRQGRGEGGIGI